MHIFLLLIILKISIFYFFNSDVIKILIFYVILILSIKNYQTNIKFELEFVIIKLY